MFQSRWKPRVDVRTPDALEWWERSRRDRDSGEAIVRLTDELRNAIARADHSERPVFLRALGRNLENELRELNARIGFAAHGSELEPSPRRELLEELVDYYCEATMPWTQEPRIVELSDCAREAVAGLSADMSLLLRVEGEPLVAAGRRRLIALCELAIRAATAGDDDEVEVVLPPCSDGHAELRVHWTWVPMSSRQSHDKARYLALAIAYAVKLGGTIRRAAGAQEGLILRIPRRQRPEDEAPTTFSFDDDVVAQATAFCG